MTGKLRVLLVEDETVVAMLMKSELQKLGYEVIKFVGTGEDAILFAKKDNPDIVIMDINLASKMDGIEAAIKINENRTVPIIFVTGYDDKNMRERALKIVPLSYLVKPIASPALKTIIDGHFRIAGE